MINLDNIGCINLDNINLRCINLGNINLVLNDGGINRGNINFICIYFGTINLESIKLLKVTESVFSGSSSLSRSQETI